MNGIAGDAFQHMFGLTEMSRDCRHMLTLQLSCASSHQICDDFLVLSPRYCPTNGRSAAAQTGRSAMMQMRGVPQ